MLNYVSPLPYNFSSLCLHVAKSEDAVHCVYQKAQIASINVMHIVATCGTYMYYAFIQCSRLCIRVTYILLIAFHPQMLECLLELFDIL